MIVLITASLRVLCYFRQVCSLNTAKLSAYAGHSLLVLGPILEVALEISSCIVLEYHSIK